MSTVSNQPSPSFLSMIKGDFLPSVAVFLVALPLCMGIAIASGAPVAAGLITGIVGGIIVGMLAGAPLQVSGPAAGLTVIIYDIIQQHGLESLGIVVLLAGLLQVVAGTLRLGQWFRAVSPAVIQGMLAGIGVLIFASQFHVMIDDAPKSSGIANLVTIPEAIAKGLPLPERTTGEERARRTALLKEVGMLHERQSTVYDSLASMVPEGVGEDFRVPSNYLSGLIAVQEEITEELGDLASRIADKETATPINGKAERAATVALADSEAALAHLHDFDVANWHETQQGAVQSLEALLTNLKSHAWAAKVGMLTLLALVLWQLFGTKRFRGVPAPLVAVVVATLAAALWSLPVLYVEVPDSLLSAVRLPSMSVLTDTSALALLGSGIVVALIASAETLLCATAVDQMQNGPRTNYDRELFAQGVGNTVCGVLGALPMTGVIVRSAANVQAGGKSRVSAILHGIWLLIFVGMLGFLLRSIPVASLAAILVYTGYKLVNIKQVKQLRKYGWSEVLIYLATVIGIVATDLLVGVAIGIALSAIKLLYTFSHLGVSVEDDPQSNRTVLSLEGAATFLRLPYLAAQLDQVPANAELHVDFQHLDYIDHACLNLLMNWANQHESSGGSLVIDWDSLHAHFRGDPLMGKRLPAAGARVA